MRFANTFANSFAEQVNSEISEIIQVTSRIEAGVQLYILHPLTYLSQCHRRLLLDLIDQNVIGHAINAEPGNLDARLMAGSPARDVALH